MKNFFSLKKNNKIKTIKTINIRPEETSEKHFQNKQILTRASQKNTIT